MIYDAEAAANARTLGRNWLFRELVHGLIFGSLMGWGLWMLGCALFQSSIIGMITSFLILSGIGWHKLQRICLGMFGLGLIIWAHVPAIDYAVELARNVRFSYFQ